MCSTAGGYASVKLSGRAKSFFNILVAGSNPVRGAYIQEASAV